MRNIENALKILGLKEKEIKIILALVAISNLSESGVSRVTKLPRTTIIPVLQKLKERGLVQKIKVLGRKRWKVEDFKKIRSQIMVVYEAFGTKKLN